MDKHKIPQATIDILGLTKYEIKIIETISNIGKKVSTISRITKIPRTSLLYILKALEKRRLVAPVKIGKYTYWKSNTINAFRILKNSKSDVIIYDGLEEVLTIFDKLTEQPMHARVQGIQPDKSITSLLKKMPLERAVEINKKIKSKKIIMEGIVHEQTPSSILDEFGKKYAEAIFNSFIGRLEDYVKIPDDFADVESEMYIFGGSAFIINWNTETGIEIHNKDMVALLSAMFACTKELGFRYSQNQKMAKHIAPSITPPNTPQ